MVFSSERGFTLVELLVVIAIIGILTALAIPAYIGQQRSAARSEAYSNLESLRLLEEQFFAENGRYTADLGAGGNTRAVRDANLALIQDAANDADIDELRGFRPGAEANFSYQIVQNSALPNAPAVPFDPNSVVGQTPCFTAIATGLTGSRVDGDIFAIDCNNSRNF